jgi:hypothetical protein
LVGEGVFGRVEAPGTVVGAVTVLVVVVVGTVVGWPGGGVDVVVGALVVVVPGGGVGTVTVPQLSAGGFTFTGSRKMGLEVYW